MPRDYTSHYRDHLWEYGDGVLITGMGGKSKITTQKRGEEYVQDYIEYLMDQPAMEAFTRKGKTVRTHAIGTRYHTPHGEIGYLVWDPLNPDHWVLAKMKRWPTTSDEWWYLDGFTKTEFGSFVLECFEVCRRTLHRDHTWDIG